MKILFHKMWKTPVRIISEELSLGPKQNIPAYEIVYYDQAFFTLISKYIEFQGLILTPKGRIIFSKLFAALRPLELIHE